jgi:hypothetical protein
LFTNCFVSASILQLFVTINLEFIGVLSREASWNTVRLVALCCLSEICGSFTALVFAQHRFAIGANAGIFGVYGGFLALYGIALETSMFPIAVLFILFLNVILLIFAPNLKHSSMFPIAVLLRASFRTRTLRAALSLHAD